MPKLYTLAQTAEKLDRSHECIKQHRAKVGVGVQAGIMWLLTSAEVETIAASIHAAQPGWKKGRKRKVDAQQTQGE